MPENQSLIPRERIERSILLIRGQKVILDMDLASLYGVETKDAHPIRETEHRAIPRDFACSNSMMRNSTF